MWVCLSESPGITPTFLHASTSDFTHSLIPTPGRFPHLFQPILSFPISAITLKRFEATPNHTGSSPFSGRVALQCPRFIVAAASHDSSVRARLDRMLQVENSILGLGVAFVFSFSSGNRHVTVSVLGCRAHVSWIIWA